MPFGMTALARQIIESWIDDVNAVGVSFRGPRRAMPRSASRVNAVVGINGRSRQVQAGEDFAALTAAAVRSVLVDGECVRPPSDPKARGQTPREPGARARSIRRAMPISVDGDSSGRAATITQGIERDVLGRVTAYHVERLRAGGAAAGKRLDGPAADSSSLDAAHLRRGAARPGPRRVYPGDGAPTAADVGRLARLQCCSASSSRTCSRGSLPTRPRPRASTPRC